jgi:hypothetical protein
MMMMMMMVRIGLGPLPDGPVLHAGSGRAAAHCDPVAPAGGGQGAGRRALKDIRIKQTAQMGKAADFGGAGANANNEE